MAHPASTQASHTLEKLQGLAASIASGLTGHIIGVVTQYGENPQSKRVIPASIGIPSSTRNQSPSGYPNTTGSFPGARGAQLIGKFIHPPHPYPHASASEISFAISAIS